MYGYETFHDELMLDMLRAARHDRSRHAYIFEGSEDAGLYPSARLFAAALTCEDTQSAPCGSCPSCRRSASNTNPDIITFVKPKDKSTIGVDTARAVADDAYIKPFGSGKKVYIIKNADLMTPQAQNALLKTLEEPPEFAVFILIAEDAQLLLQTVRSRCVTVRFPRVSDDAVRKYIQNTYPDAENIDFLVKYAAGAPHSIDDIIGDAEFAQLRADSFDALARILSHRRLDTLEAADFLETNKTQSDVIMELWLSFMRDIILIQHGCPSLITNTDFSPRLTRAADSLEESHTVNIQKNLIRASEMLKRSVNARAAVLWTGL